MLSKEDINEYFDTQLEHCNRQIVLTMEGGSINMGYKKEKLILIDHKIRLLALCTAKQENMQEVLNDNRGIVQVVSKSYDYLLGFHEGVTHAQ